MESPNYEQYQQNEPAQPQRPDFLKILCILSFISCGLWILICAIGTMVLSLDRETIDKAWSQMLESNPQFESIDPMEFMHNFGMWCVYTLIANIFSLIGVIMMWRLERIGFFIYVVAELSTHFFRLELGPAANQSIAGTIFMVLIDLVFIFMYFTNLKYMKGKSNTNYIQSGN